MAGVNFIPQLWNAKVLRVNEDNLIAKKICRAPYKGEIKNQGDTVYFPGLADPTVSSYSGTINYENLQDASLTLKIDQADYFAFKVGDIEAAQQGIDLKGSQADRAGYKIMQKADSYVMGFHGEAKSLITQVSVTSANIISTLGLAQQKLAENFVMDEDMWMAIPPWVRLKLQLAGIKFQVNNGINGTGGVAWTNELGFDLYVTNQIVNIGSVAVPESLCMAGSYNSIAFADQITETEMLRLQASFDNAVRGLHVYGAKVVKPNELVKLDLTLAAETTI